MLSINFLRRVDASAGFVLGHLARLLRRRRRKSVAPAPASAPRILCIKCWGIGSILLISPTLRAVKRRWPRARIEFLTLPETAEVCRLIPEIDEVVTVDLRRPGFPLAVLKLFAAVRSVRYDLVIDFEFSSNFTALLAFWSGSPSIGFTSLKPERDALYDIGVVFDHSLHARDCFGRVAGFLECGAAGEPRAPLGTNRMDEARFPFLSRPFIVVNPNAGDLSFQRRWPRERYAAAVRELLRLTDQAIVLIGGASDRVYMAPLAEAFRSEGRVIPLVGALTLSELAGLLRRAALYIGNDSGPMHLAATVGTPCVALFGPETPHLYGPLPSERHEVLYARRHCSPCLNVYRYKIATCRDNRCLQAIGTDEVVAAALRLLAARKEGKR
jgi:ADP-heptose:LPS heptosyltransferase